MVLNSVLKVVSASTSLLIRHNKVREGCVYVYGFTSAKGIALMMKRHMRLRVLRSSSDAQSSFPRSSVVDSLLTWGMLKTTRADLRWTASTPVLRVFGRGSQEQEAYSSTGLTSCLLYALIRS